MRSGRGSLWAVASTLLILAVAGAFGARRGGGGRDLRARPDVVLVLPWNLETEIAAQLSYVRDWGGEIVVPLPHVHTVPAPAAATPTEVLS